jgi:hypothetical protein
MTMEGFVGRALQQFRDRSSRSDRELRSAIDAVFVDLERAGLHPGGGAGTMSAADEIGPADKYWPPFRLACQHGKQEMRQAALDSIEKLIAHGFLRGGGPPSSCEQVGGGNSGSSRGGGGGGGSGGGATKDDQVLLIDEIVHTICECKESASAGVELQMIKALLTVVSSPTTSRQVHGMSLVYAVRACYQIFLVTQNAVNKVTAKGCLTQMLHFVFQAMEDFDVRRRADLEKVRCCAAASLSCCGLPLLRES